MSKTEPDDWFQALETAQLALDVYQNHIRNPQVLEPHSEYFMFASLEDELVSWIGSLLYRLGRYEDYQGLEESYPKVMLRAENLWQGIVLRQKAEMSVLPILRAALDLYPFDADVALQALPYEVELNIQDRINYLGLEQVNSELFPILLAQRDVHQEESRVLDFLREIGWVDPRLDSALALDNPDAMVPPRWTGEWDFDLLLFSRRLLTNLPQDYIARIDVNQDRITDQWLIFQNDELIYWLQDWDQNWVASAEKIDLLLSVGVIDPQINLVLQWQEGSLERIIESQGTVRGILSFSTYPFVSTFEITEAEHSLMLHFPPQKMTQEVLTDQPNLIPPLFTPQIFDSSALVMDQTALMANRVRLEERINDRLVRSDWVYRGQILQRMEDLSGRGFFDSRIDFELGKPHHLYWDMDGDGIYEVQGRYEDGRLVSLYSDVDKNLVTEYGQVYINSRVEYWDLDQDGDIEFRILSDLWGITQTYRYPFSSFAEKETPDW
jgi:hypothetical protein